MTGMKAITTDIKAPQSFDVEKRATLRKKCSRRGLKSSYTSKKIRFSVTLNKYEKWRKGKDYELAKELMFVMIDWKT